LEEGEEKGMEGEEKRRRREKEKGEAGAPLNFFCVRP